MEINSNSNRLPRAINYLHYGDALDHLRKAISGIELQRIPKSRLLDEIDAQGCSTEYGRQILHRYGGANRKTIDLEDLAADLNESSETRIAFASLRCRGFSYELVTNISGFPVQVRSAINVRLGIFADVRSHYPTSVLRFLKYTRSNHYYHFHGPAIGFLLGIHSGKTLYVVTLQSDVTCGTPSAIREHFRGWRRVLLKLTLDHYRPKRCLLVRSEDVLRACHSDYDVPTSVPKSWRNIYEQSAKELGGNVVELRKGINIQLYPRHPKVIAREFHSIKGDEK